MLVVAVGVDGGCRFGGGMAVVLAVLLVAVTAVAVAVGGGCRRWWNWSCADLKVLSVFQGAEITLTDKSSSRIVSVEGFMKDNTPRTTIINSIRIPFLSSKVRFGAFIVSIVRPPLLVYVAFEFYSFVKPERQTFEQNCPFSGQRSSSKQSCYRKCWISSRTR